MTPRQKLDIAALENAADLVKKGGRVVNLLIEKPEPRKKKRSAERAGGQK